MKSVLVIDTPEYCGQCPCFRYGEDNYCAATGETNYSHRCEKPTDCPLKQLPEEDNDEHISEWGRGYQGGWNDCIDAIVGDKND